MALFLLRLLAVLLLFALRGSFAEDAPSKEAELPNMRVIDNKAFDLDCFVDSEDIHMYSLLRLENEVTTEAARLSTPIMAHTNSLHGLGGVLGGKGRREAKEKVSGFLTNVWETTAQVYEEAITDDGALDNLLTADVLVFIMEHGAVSPNHKKFKKKTGRQQYSTLQYLTSENIKLVRASIDKQGNPVTDSLPSRRRMTAERAKKRFLEGYSMVWNNIHYHWPGLASFSRVLSDDFGFRVSINAYFTPKGGVAFAPHNDWMDVFVFQLQGSKMWTLYQPPTDPFILQALQHAGEYQGMLPFREQTVRPSAKGLAQFTAETHVLRRGDVMYIPRGMVHSASAETAEENSLHISVGVEVDPMYTYQGLLHLLLVESAQEAHLYLEGELENQDNLSEEDDLMHKTLAEAYQAGLPVCMIAPSDQNTTQLPSVLSMLHFYIYYTATRAERLGLRKSLDFSGVSQSHKKNAGIMDDTDLTEIWESTLGLMKEHFGVQIGGEGAEGSSPVKMLEVMQNVKIIQQHKEFFSFDDAIIRPRIDPVLDADYVEYPILDSVDLAELRGKANLDRSKRPIPRHIAQEDVTENDTRDPDADRVQVTTECIMELQQNMLYLVDGFSTWLLQQEPPSERRAPEDIHHVRGAAFERSWAWLSSTALKQRAKSNERVEKHMYTELVYRARQNLPEWVGPEMGYTPNPQAERRVVDPDDIEHKEL